MAKTAEQKKYIRGVYEDDKVEILVGETQTIIPLQELMCPGAYVFKLANGEIVVGAEPISCPCWRRSKDGGRTWEETPAWPTCNAYQFPDGEIIHLSSSWLVEAGKKGAYKTEFYRSADNGYTHKEETTTLTDIPELFEFSHEGKKVSYAYIDHAIVRLSDGSLLASVHAGFKSDYEKTNKWRVIVVRSVDRGKTWHYLSTVAFDLTKGQNLRLQGFCEPDLLTLPNGEILCFMRTGGEYRNRRYTPLYMSRSDDNGKTWSQADPVADRGVYPKSCLMENGVIAVVYGRPGDWLMFSLDQGETWISHFCLYQGPLAYDCGNYDWIEAVGPDTVLVAYARTDHNDSDGMKSEIVGTYITVKRK